MPANNKPEKKKNLLLSLIFRFFGKILLLTFSGFKLLSLNKKLKIANSIEKDPWFKKQINRNRIIAIIVTLPLLFAGYSSYKILKNDKRLIKGTEYTINYLKKMEIKKASKMINKTLESRKTQNRLNTAKNILLYTFLISLLFGLLINYKHPLVEDTKKFKKLLDRRNNDTDYFALATPVGYLVKLEGEETADSLLRNEVTWRGMNVKVNSYEESLSNRELVFYKKGYELKKVYAYIL